LEYAAGFIIEMQYSEFSRARLAIANEASIDGMRALGLTRK
jgi:hypothetical protein